VRQLRFVIALGIFVGVAFLVADFWASNKGPVDLDLPFMQPMRPPLAFALLGAFALGALAASLGLLVKLARKSLGTRRLQRQVAGLESELRELRPPAPVETAALPEPSRAGRPPGT
jgi:uncharacterized integral membrane protein